MPHCYKCKEPIKILGIINDITVAENTWRELELSCGCPKEQEVRPESLDILFRLKNEVPNDLVMKAAVREIEKLRIRDVWELTRLNKDE